MAFSAWDPRVIKHSSTQHPNLYKFLEIMSIINVYAAILISFNFIIKSGDASAEWAMC